MTNEFAPLWVKIYVNSMWDVPAVSIKSEEHYERVIAALTGEEPYISFLEEDGTGILFYKSYVRYIHIYKTEENHGQADQKG